MAPQEIWKSVCGEIEVELGKSNFNLFFKNSVLLSLEQGIARIGFKNKGVADQVNFRYYTLVQNALCKIAKQDKVSLVFEILAIPQTASEEEENEIAGPLFQEIHTEKENVSEAIKRAGLRADFTLEEFCVSTSNQLAFAAAQAVVKDPGKNYNPFFIWGGVGVGKTHLMQAIGHEVLRKNPRGKVVYAPGEQFTNEIVSAIRNKSTHEFRSKYRTADALLIDDVQFIAGRDTTQEEFFHTFNEIQTREGQIVMTCDRKPADIKDLADRLRSRFEGGLVADISTPDSELKTAICLLKAKKRGIELDNKLAGLLSGAADNIRSLEGTLQKVISYAQVHKRELSPELIQEVLGLSPNSSGNTVRIDNRKIMDIVCAYYDIPMKLIKGEKRDKPIALPRQVLMYLLKTNTNMTYMEIADFLGGRDHTTILHGVKKIESLISNNERVKTEVGELEKQILSH